MLRWIMRQIRQEEEITITMIQFQLGSRIIIAIKAHTYHPDTLPANSHNIACEHYY